MIVGNLLAIAQTSLKRLLAYSGVAQAGYILIGVIAGGKTGPRGGALLPLHLPVHELRRVRRRDAARRPRRRSRRHLRTSTASHRRSWPMAVLMSVFMLSLAGFPPFVGFFGKLFLFTAGVNAGLHVAGGAGRADERRLRLLLHSRARAGLVAGDALRTACGRRSATGSRSG